MGLSYLTDNGFQFRHHFKTIMGEYLSVCTSLFFCRP